jgi:hypothetical protein
VANNTANAGAGTEIAGATGYYTVVVISNSIISGNSAALQGAGFNLGSTNSTTFTNVTFFDNVGELAVPVIVQGREWGGGTQGPLHSPEGKQSTDNPQEIAWGQILSGVSVSKRRRGDPLANRYVLPKGEPVQSAVLEVLITQHYSHHKTISHLFKACP